MCLGPEVESGKYAAGFNTAGLGEGLGVYLHGEVRVEEGAGNVAAGSCGRVDEGRVVDLQAAAGVNGWLNGAGAGAAALGGQGQVSTTKKRRRMGKG